MRRVSCCGKTRKSREKIAQKSNLVEPEVQAIIVLGAAQYDGRPSRILQARLEEARRIAVAIPGVPIVTVGGKLPGDRFTEAEVGAKYLSGHTAVMPVPEGNDTVESLRAIRRRHGFERVIIVTDPLHRLRAWLIARDEGFVARVVGAAGYPTPTFAPPWWRYLAHELGGLVVFGARKVLGEELAEHLRSGLHRIEALIRPTRRARHEEIRNKTGK